MRQYGNQATIFTQLSFLVASPLTYNDPSNVYLVSVFKIEASMLESFFQPWRMDSSGMGFCMFKLS